MDGAGPNVEGLSGFRKLTAHYLGGHPKFPKEKQQVFVHIDPSGIQVRSFKTIMTFEWDEVRGLRVEDGEQAQSRITATRLVTLGVFALAAKKKGKSSCFLSITTDEGDAIFDVEKANAHQVQAKLQPALAWIAARNPAAPEPAPEQHTASVADELKKLADLRDAGVLSDEEFAAQKAKLLG